MKMPNGGFQYWILLPCLPTKNDYNKIRNYWKYLKVKLKNEGSQVVSATIQLKLLAPDGKRRLADMLDYEGIIGLSIGSDLTNRVYL
jgi:cell filamentation protein